MQYSHIFNKNGYPIFVPMIKFEYNDLCNLILNYRSELPEQLEILRKELKTTTNYKWDTSNFFVSNRYGDIFYFTISSFKSTIFRLNIWNMQDMSVGYADITDDKEETKKFLDRLGKELEEYSRRKTVK